jgi:hypothetical protein
MIKSEHQKEKGRKNRTSRDLWGSISWRHALWDFQKEKNEKMGVRIFEERIAENFPNAMKLAMSTSQ